MNKRRFYIVEERTPSVMVSIYTLFTDIREEYYVLGNKTSFLGCHENNKGFPLREFYFHRYKNHRGSSQSFFWEEIYEV